jgi:hypothetical protein
VQENVQQGLVDADLAVVLDKAQFSEFVHEEIDPGPRRSKGSAEESQKENVGSKGP